MKVGAPFRELRAQILASIRESSGMATDFDLLEKLSLQSEAF